MHFCFQLETHYEHKNRLSISLSNTMYTVHCTVYKHLPQDFPISRYRPFKYIFVSLCRRYECRAQNPYGEAIHEMELAEARLPGMMSQVITKPKSIWWVVAKDRPEAVFVNVKGVQESIPRHQIRQSGSRFLGSLKGLQIRTLAEARPSGMVS